MVAATEIKGIERSDSHITVETDGPAIRLYFLTDDIVRIRASFDRRFTEESYILTLTGWPDRLDDVIGSERRRIDPVKPDFRESKDGYEFGTKSLRLVLTKAPFGFEIFLADGERLHADLTGRAFSRDHLGRVFHYRERRPSDRYFGFGETTGPLDKAGRRVRLSPKDAIGYDAKGTGCLYKHIPFFIRLDGESRRASGLFYHNFWNAEFEMGSEISGYWHPYTYYCADGGDIDLFFINGPGIADVVRRYTDLTGKTVMPPKGSLGYLGSTMYYSELPADCDDAILGFVDKTRDEGIPIDGFQLSSGYTVGAENKRYVFTWNETRFKDPEGFFTAMSDRGVIVSPNVKPGILLTHPHYGEFADAGGFMRASQADDPHVDRWWGGPGSFVDFTNPEGRKVWRRLMIDSLISKGVSSIWNDNCEFETGDAMARCECDGVAEPAGAVRALQANLMSRESHEAMREARPGERPFVICRSGAAGIQRYAQTWAGDNRTEWKSLRCNIATMLGLGLSGVANQGCDIGGFFGPAPEAELLVRWVQNGIFQPRFSIHSSNNDNTVTEPWMYADVTPLIREAIRFRYALLPYYYSLLREAHDIGAPILRPLVYEFQGDPNCDGEDVQFMAGSALLVANVVERDAETREVYLPAGNDWFEWNSRERIEGGQIVEMEVDLSSIPIFIRDGSIIPMSPGLTSIAKDEVKELTVIVAPGRDASFTLYEDDGRTTAYEDGDYLKTRIHLTAGERTVLSFAHEGAFESPVETIRLEVINDRKGAFWVSVAGRRIPQFLDRDKWAEADSGWIHEAGARAVLVKYPKPESDYDVTVSFEDFDLIGMDG